VKLPGCWGAGAHTDRLLWGPGPHRRSTSVGTPSRTSSSTIFITVWRS
jgi:hypothetical protein